MIEKSPIFGAGFGTFMEIMQVYRGSGEVAHNTYIQIVAESHIAKDIVIVY